MENVKSIIDGIYRTESRRVFATLIRLIGDFDLAEEALHEAFAVALEQWENKGIPEKPVAWLVSTGRFKAIDVLRRRTRFDATVAELALSHEYSSSGIEELDEVDFKDDQLRLIFTCCHPALSPDTQIALTLREICGLTTEEVASAFLVSNATIAQRIVRGKAKIRNAKIPYEVPDLSDLPERLDSVLSIIYLIFNEGYSASSGMSLTRPDLSMQAISLGRVLLDLFPDAEVKGLLALMLLHESRRDARETSDGDLILLEDQDRSRWNQEYIREGKTLIEEAFTSRRFGVYTIQAAISAIHADAVSTAATDWTQIVALYEILMRFSPSPVIELNHAVAIAMRDRLEDGLLRIHAILARGDLTTYHLAFAAQADLYRRLGKMTEAQTAYERALALAKQEPERRFLYMRLCELRKNI